PGSGRRCLALGSRCSLRAPIRGRDGVAGCDRLRDVRIREIAEKPDLSQPPLEALHVPTKRGEVVDARCIEAVARRKTINTNSIALSEERQELIDSKLTRVESGTRRL